MPIPCEKFRFDLESIKHSPDRAGVYALYDGDEIIYYGRADGLTVTIRSRLEAHRSGQEGPCTKNPTHYSREVLARPAERERELLEEYMTLHDGQLPRCNGGAGLAGRPQPGQTARVG